MNSFGNQHLTEDQVNRAVREWSERHEGTTGATINDLAETLRISPAEAQSLVNRSTTPPMHSSTPRARDNSVWISFGAAVLVAGIVIAILGATVFSRRAPVSVYTSGAPVMIETPMPPAPAPDANSFDAEALNSQAWQVVDNPSATEKDLLLAEQIAERANEMSSASIPHIVDTLARAKWRLGKFEEAVELQKKAVDLLGSSSGRTDYFERLEQYRRALETNSAKK